MLVLLPQVTVMDPFMQNIVACFSKGCLKASHTHSTSLHAPNPHLFHLVAGVGSDAAHWFSIVSVRSLETTALGLMVCVTKKTHCASSGGFVLIPWGPIDRP